MRMMKWYYQGREAFWIAKHGEPDKYWIWADPTYCQVKIDDKVIPSTSWRDPVAIPKTSLRCVHVTFDDSPDLIMSKTQPHLQTEKPQKIVTGSNYYVQQTQERYHVVHEVKQTPIVTARPAGAGSGGPNYTGEFLLTLTPRPVPEGSGNSSDFVHAYCSALPQDYLNFGGNFWALFEHDENDYILARPEFEVHYNDIDPTTPVPVSLPLSAADGGGPPHAAGSRGLAHLPEVGLVSEMPPPLALGAHAPDLGPVALAAAQDAPLHAAAAAADAELPKKKRMKALKFFDGADAAGGSSA
jgi:hypothetical protein